MPPLSNVSNVSLLFEFTEMYRSYEVPVLSCHIVSGNHLWRTVKFRFFIIPFWNRIIDRDDLLQKKHPSKSPPMVYFYMIYIVLYIYLHLVQFYGCIMSHIGYR